MKIPKKEGYSLMKDSTLKAVHDDDLEGLLNSLGYLSDIRNGNCKCHFCGKIITLENLGSIFPQNGKICFSCEDTICVRKLVESGGKYDDT